MKYYHLGELIHQQGVKYKNKTALKYQLSGGKWANLSWADFSDKVMKTAQAMSEMGIQPEDNIGIYSQNMEKYLITDFGAYANKAVMVPMYATASPSQVKYIVNDARIGVIFVGEQFQYNNAHKVQKECPVLKKLIVFNRDVVLNPEDETSVYFDDFITTGDNSESLAQVNSRLRQLKDTDLATIIYTSGTTGEPKGVMLTHANYLQAFKIHDKRLNCSEKDLSMCFLPLTHIFEKAWTYYCLHKGITVAVNNDPSKIQTTLKQIRPTLMSNVPRFWEKVYLGIREKIDSATGVTKWLFDDVVKTGRKHNLLYINEGKKPPIGNSIKFFIYRHTICYFIKRVVGIDRGNFFPVAGAPLSDTINEFMQSIDVRIIYGYGLTETTATVSCFPSTRFKIGTVGEVMPDVEVKIGENNEVLIKGETVMSGYYNKPEITAAVFTEDGFFKTGDAGYVNTADNTITLTDRIKDLYKTSNGKYIAPQMIETRISEDKYIDQVAVIGDERKFVSALIVPNYDALKIYADTHGIDYETVIDLVKKPEINDFISGRIELLQSQFTSYEKIKRFALLAAPFTMESGELTNTLKLRRKVVLERYADVIDGLYVD